MASSNNFPHRSPSPGSFRDPSGMKGWILDGIPETREQALMIQTLGISPRHVRSPPSQPWETLRNQWKLETTEKLPIRNNPRCGKSLPYRDVAVTGGPEGGRPAVFTLALSAPDTVLIERNLGKRIDPQTGEIYHTTFDWPPESEIQNRLMMPAGISEGETARKLLEYHRNIVRILPSYPKILKVINADQPCVDVFYQALTYVQTSHRSNAPFTPRVLLCGPVGSGKSLQAALLAQKYGLINVCCGQLLKEAVADKSKYGEMIQPFFEKEIAVPDNIIMKVLKQRLDQQDCVERGWVLHGFPRDLDQAHVMDSLGYKPNRVFFLNVPLDSVIERLTLRRTDPVTGERYHLMYKPPPTMEVQARLLQNPKESEEQIKLKMDLFYRNSAELEQFYGEAITLNGDQDPYTVFEYIESGIINPLPKKVP
ncbi:adenylate kinase 8 isoform X10 [Cervus elaphus]|uniref:adenylate kinase 8 isoform X10 n=1 Tax=Cervus canadensis TaxID=1574408 RepID=UPI001C9E573A|nr:adenylate kinase 8 isoform X10 [Cervus canadensis]XP_043772448.1 adenylate kinase 8 isoform X10 [Cervus elaphus]